MFYFFLLFVQLLFIYLSLSFAFIPLLNSILKGSSVYILRAKDWGSYFFSYVSGISCNPAGGGYVITPVNQGKQSLVKHMLAIDWKFWKFYLRRSSARSITIRMLERVAGIFLIRRNCSPCSSKIFTFLFFFSFMV